MRSIETFTFKLKITISNPCYSRSFHQLLKAYLLSFKFGQCFTTAFLNNFYDVQFILNNYGFIVHLHVEQSEQLLKMCIFQ